MTSWYWEPGEDTYAKYEAEDALTPEQSRQELADIMERPYGSIYYGPKKIARAPEMTAAEWDHDGLYTWVCERCGKEGKDSGCDFCGAICRRVKKHG